MSVELDRLARLLPPPPGNMAAPPWERSRSEIGFDFPADYQEFVSRYGGGYILPDPDSLGFIVSAPYSGAWRPGGTGGFQGFVDRHTSEVRPAFAFEGADEDYWGGIVYPVYPDKGGLLSWGESEEGDYCFWLTEATDPNSWPVVMWPRHEERSYRFDGGMVEFLLAVFGGAHPASGWLAGPAQAWTMTSDWLRSGLAVSAGPADRTG